AGVAVHHDLVFGQTRSNLVATSIRAHDSERARVIAFDLKGIANGELSSRRADGERFDFVSFKVLELGRRERREVEPLFGLAFELDGERAHEMISLRWK